LIAAGGDVVKEDVGGVDGALGQVLLPFAFGGFEFLREGREGGREGDFCEQ